MVEVEERIAVPVGHPLRVERVPLVEANRERPEPELLLELRVDAARHLLRHAHVGWEQLVSIRDGDPAGALLPLGRLLARHQEDELEPVAETLA